MLKRGVRTQYHFRPSHGRVLIWNVARLLTLSQDLPRVRVALDRIRELDEPYWFRDHDPLPTCRAVIEHARSIHDADLSFPIILSADGGVMDGMHRVAKAVLEGRTEIDAVRFEQDPEPDYVDRRPEELSY
jgi:hypothetical protein